MQTISEARKQLFGDVDQWKKGQDCPCCDQFVKLYERPIHNVMALMLLKLYELDHADHKNGIRSPYHHVSEFMVTISGTNDFSKLRYWGLVVEMKNDDNEKKRTSGCWAITEKGRQFVEGDITVPSHVLLYNATYRGYSGNHVHFDQTLPTGFNYSEIMGKYKTKGVPEQSALL